MISYILIYAAKIQRIVLQIKERKGIDDNLPLEIAQLNC